MGWGGISHGNMAMKSIVLLPGQFCSLQRSSAKRAPSHSLPPWAEVAFLVLVFVLIPPPHDLVHPPMIQSFHLQSTIPYIGIQYTNKSIYHYRTRIASKKELVVKMLKIMISYPCNYERCSALPLT